MSSDYFFELILWVFPLITFFYTAFSKLSHLTCNFSMFEIGTCSIFREFEGYSKDRQITEAYVLNNISVGLKNLFGEVSYNYHDSI